MKSCKECKLNSLPQSAGGRSLTPADLVADVCGGGRLLRRTSVAADLQARVYRGSANPTVTPLLSLVAHTRPPWASIR